MYFCRTPGGGMADPTIQTLCCKHTSDSDIGLTIMQELDTNAYNTVCLVSSIVGVIGAIYQILPRQETTNSHRWLSVSATRGRQIIIWLAVADLFASLGVLVRSSLWIKYQTLMPSQNETTSIVFCAVSSAWTQYFYMVTWLWTLCYAIDMRLVLREREGHPKYYHLVSWTLPAVLTVLGLTILYVPDADCHSMMSLSTAVSRILPNYFATYLPITIVMIANPILYVSSSKSMEKILHRSYGQITNKEREIMDAVKLKFSFINIVFYVCWIPNLLNGILLWTLWFHLPVKIIITVWYIMAVTNPLQALFNSIVYRRWSRGTERVNISWKSIYHKASSKFSSSSTDTTPAFVPRETLPLLQSVPRDSINMYASVD